MDAPAEQGSFGKSGPHARETGTLGAGRAPDRHSAAGRRRLWNRDPMTTPIYQEIKDFILARIHAGEWAEGDQVPSENELARIQRRADDREPRTARTDRRAGAHAHARLRHVRRVAEVGSRT
jgi:hypothetical protein